MIGMVILAVLAPIAALLIQMAISRSREFAADEGAARLTHKPWALASALEKLELAGGRRTLVQELSPADHSGVPAIQLVSMSADEKWYAYSYSRDVYQLFTVENVK